MRRLIIAVAMVALLGGYAYPDDISDKLEQEALAVINAHKSKLDAEDAVQREKDAEIEKQRNVQADALKKERLSQEQIKKATAKAEEERAKAEAARNARADMELRLRAAELEEARKARRSKTIHDMQRAVDAVDARWEQRRAAEQQQLDNAISREQANRQAAMDAMQRAETNSRLREIERNQQLNWMLRNR
jgi:hypothetical protein